MKTETMLYPVLLGVLLCAPTAGFAQFSPGQSFSGGIATPGIDAALIAASSPESSLYAKGASALNEGRWADAESIFASSERDGTPTQIEWFWMSARATSPEGRIARPYGPPSCAAPPVPFAAP